MKKNGFSVVLVAMAVAFIAVAGLVYFTKVKRPPLTPEQTAKGGSKNFVAIGASTTKANDLSSKMVGDNPDYSFATGTKIESVYKYLKSKGENIIPRNLAESGVDSAKVLSQQVPNALSYEPKYILIDIMADIFFEDKPIKFRQNLTEIVQKLKKPGTIILVGTYPNLFTMRKAGFSSCSQDKLGIGINKITEEKLKSFNQAIADVANKEGIILVDNFDTLSSSDVSDYDCLHPNIEAQKKLAKSWITALEKGR